MSTGSGVLDFVIGAVAVAASFFVPGLPAWAASGLFAVGSTYAQMGMQRMRMSQEQEGIKQNVRSTQANLPVVYGTTRIGAKVVDVRQADDADGAFGDLHPEIGAEDVLVRVLAFAVGSENGSGINSISNVQFYGKDENVITTLDGTDMSTTNVQGRFVDYLKYTRLLGADGQTRPASLGTHAGWGTDMKGEGIGSLALFLLWDSNVYRGGIPNVTALVEGNRVYDPRDPTGGPDSDGFVFSNNPALCILDYLTSKRYGAGVAYDARDGGGVEEIDEQSFIDAANYFDEVVNVGGVVNQTRFTMDGWVDTSKKPARNLRDMLSSCRSDLIWQNGQYRLVVRQEATAETFELTEDNIIGEWEWTRLGSTVPNLIEATFVDADSDYQPASVVWPLTGDTTFLDADNGVENRIEVELPFTTDYYTALQIALVTLKEARQDVMVQVTATEAALQLQVGEVVQLTHETPGWTQKEFWVTGISVRPDATVRLMLQEYDVNAYNIETLAARATLPGTDLRDPFQVDAPSALTLTSDSSTAIDTQDGQAIPRILADWTASPDPFLDHYEIEYKLSSASEWDRAPDASKDRTAAVITPVTDGETYDVRVLAVNHLSVRSDKDDAGANASVTAGTQPGLDVRNALDNFREINRTDTEITYGWDAGSAVDTINVYENEQTLPVGTDPWPDVGTTTPDQILDASVTNTYTVTRPPEGSVLYVQFTPVTTDTVYGPNERDIIAAEAGEANSIVSLVVDVDDEDGSAEIRLDVADATVSVRVDYNIGASPAWPTEAEVEAATDIVSISNAEGSLTLPADSVGLGEKLRVRAAPYTAASGLGGDGTATDHGSLASGEDVRTKFRVPKLEITDESEDGTDGSMTVQVNDPDNLADELFYRTKSGSGAWSAWTSKAVDPADGSTHTETVTLEEDHLSFIQFRLDYTLGGSASSDTVTSGGFDKGRIARGFVSPVLDEDAQTASAYAVGDYDTTGWKILASTTESAVSEANVDGAATISGRVLTPTDVGTLASGLQLGDEIFYGAKAIGPDGNGPYIKTSVFMKNIAPTLTVTDESEDGTNGTMDVVVDDPGAQADSLEYRTKSGTDAWSAWTDAVGGGAAPTDGTTYSQSVALQEKHLSFIQFRLTFTLRGETQRVTASSGGFDKGLIPDVTVAPIIQKSGKVSLLAKGDVDTSSVRVLASTNGSLDIAGVEADGDSVLVDDRVITPDEAGDFDLGLSLDDVFYVYAIGYSETGGTGTKSELAKAKARYNTELNAMRVQVAPLPTQWGNAAVNLRLMYEPLSDEVQSFDYEIREYHDGTLYRFVTYTVSPVSGAGREDNTSFWLFDSDASASGIVYTYDVVITPYNATGGGGGTGTAGRSFVIDIGETDDMGVGVKAEDEDNAGVIRIGDRFIAGSGIEMDTDNNQRPRLKTRKTISTGEPGATVEPDGHIWYQVSS